MTKKPTIGILGAGKLGTSLGRLFVQAGYPVLIAGSGPVEKIQLTVEVLVPGARPLSAEDLSQEADLVLLAIPLSKYQTLDREQLAGKLVIDAMNYWWETDGLDPIPSDPDQTSSEMIQDYLDQSTVVKAFNHMGYHDLEAEAHAEVPKVIALAGDDPAAKETVKNLIEDTGFYPLDLGGLRQGKVLEPGSALFGANLPLDEFQENL